MVVRTANQILDLLLGPWLLLKTGRCRSGKWWWSLRGNRSVLRCMDLHARPESKSLERGTSALYRFPPPVRYRLHINSLAQNSEHEQLRRTALCGRSIWHPDPAKPISGPVAAVVERFLSAPSPSIRGHLFFYDMQLLTRLPDYSYIESGMRKTSA
jgi:hypothetical protein